MKPDIRLISASAGSGKTFALSQKITDTIKSGNQPEKVMATTFTNKAAAELVHRIRSFLIEAGNWEGSQRIINGYVGTVNSVCGRLLKTFCFEAGLPPVLDIIPDEEQNIIFERAVSTVLDNFSGLIEPAAARLQQTEWQKTVKQIVDMARTNNISALSLKRHAAKSWEALEQILPKALPVEQENKLDRMLFDAIDTALKKIPSDDTTGATKSFTDNLKKIKQRVQNPENLTWYDWVKLIKTEPGKKSRDLWEPIAEAASVHPNHPRFHNDLRSFIFLVFDCAAQALERFAKIKQTNGLIDFVDQEALVLSLLDSKDFQNRLSERLDCLFVDEFQDTSPIQLALFVKLAGIVNTSVWVGDQKQAIYGFRGTDPVYMDEVISQIIPSQNVEILKNSYRSQPDLVAFTNKVFELAFEKHGFSSDIIHLEPMVKAVPETPVHVKIWLYDVKNNDDELLALTSAIKKMISEGDTYIVLDRLTKQPRPLKPSDIAVLCRTNDNCSQTADALETKGIRAAVPRKGLLLQMEILLCVAALRCLIDPGDSLAKAEVIRFTSSEKETPEWFQKAVKAQSNSALDDYPVVRELTEHRKQVLHMSPAEALGLAISITKLEQRILAWKEPFRRLANLDALRGMAYAYEDYCQSSKIAGTPAGLIKYLSQQGKKDADFQASGTDAMAVQVLTYHKSKGLEWPVVILTGLNSKNRADAFGTTVEPSDQPFDPLNPLKGRWIRHWPWPYSSYKKDFGFDDAVKNCPEFEKEQNKETKERLRLLYVGMTRARDYLVFSSRNNRKNEWLDALVDKNDKKILNLPDKDQITMSIGGYDLPVQVDIYAPVESEADETRQTLYQSKLPASVKEFLPARFVPSNAGFPCPRFDTEIIPIGDRLALSTSSSMDMVGNAIHGFFAVDQIGAATEKRRSIAESILRNWDITGLEPDTLITAGDRLDEFIKNNFTGNCSWFKEWPVHLKKEGQKASGWIDLLLETPDGYIIIDHKSFPGKQSDIPEQAASYAPQLAIYKEAVEKATGKPILQCFLHMPIVGKMVRVDFG
jgi:ATP-dependent exoDNAse (exonuclease V) beta subunit